MGVVYDIYSANKMSDEDYIAWLGDKVGMYSDYNELLHYLASVEFRWSLPLDENRALDGIKLRKEYISKGKIISFADEECSVLEMLVALAERIEKDIMGEPGDDHPEKWFWIMLENLDLSRQNDDDFALYYVDACIQNWMDRKYGKNGQGALFPLMESGNRLKKMQIWDQMIAYLNENYVF